MNEAEESAASLLAMSVVGVEAVNSVVTLPVAPNVRTAPGSSAVVPGREVTAAANNATVPRMRVATRQEAGGCVIGGE